MQSLRFHGIGDIRLESLPMPAITGPGQVRLKVLAAGICGSDLHNFRTGQWVSKLPVTPGHEFAGEVLESSSDNFVPGNIVVADSRVFCGHCPNCLAGRNNLCATLGFVGEVCDGGFAEQTILPDTGLLRIPAGIDPLIAAMAEPLAVALHTINRLAPVKGEKILIAGGGPIGGLIALLLADSGHGPLLLAEKNPHRAALLAEVAGTTTVALDDCGTPRYAVDATGSAAVAESLLNTIAPGGTIALVGLFHAKPQLDLNLIVEREIDIRGCSVFAGEMPEAIAMLPRLAEKLCRISAPPIGLAGLPDAYASLLRGETTSLKTLIQP
jgi:(R,R)-butanediol dehydrogenase/meso-butanediol dehydrogenase/diacetyl reductase